MDTESEAPIAARCEQIDAASQRFAETAPQREEVARRRAASDSEVVDSKEQILARADRLLVAGEVPAQAVIELGRQDPIDSIGSLERVIGFANELQAVNFLARGTRAAAAVARISLADNGREVPMGTGSLVSPQLLLTNNHVLPEPEAAERVVVEFSAEVGIDNVPTPTVRHRLAPAGFFVTDQHLDYTLVRVAPGPDGAVPGTAFGWNPLIADPGKIVIGEAMNVVGHPSGRLKEISIRNNRLDLQLDDFLHYSSDTEPGNSGSPVFNDQWEIVALHHAGVPKKDDTGRVLRKDGKLWQPGDGDDAIDWIANEGTRVSVLLRDLASRKFDPAQRALLDELGPAANLPAETGLAVATPPAPQRAPATESLVRGLQGRPGAFGGRRSVLFLHGRGQQGRDPAELRRTWTAGLNKGLTSADRSPLDPADVYFPFYGDQLVTSMDTREAVDTGSVLYERLVAEAAQRVGMPGPDELPTDPEARELFDGIGAVVLDRLHDQLGWIAARSGLDSVLIVAIFKDVAAYLDDERVRKSVLDTVLTDVPPSGELILVSHSLGTVVAMDLLSELPREVNVSLLVTAGSPLGLDSVYRKLLSGGAHRPERVGEWLNTWYAGDPIAIGCPLRQAWGTGVADLPVENSKERAHDIAEYLAHAAVAGAIGKQLTVTSMCTG
ncbi:trypsin-like serine peptidase [Nocardia higoensis]|uniref:trypsin-like serine peptidase n=1 Tax=Nocardia higoensis TaxID=228599 RepID=UPI0002D978F7|nr:serine protease [Nocardia higoensis]